MLQSRKSSREFAYSNKFKNMLQKVCILINRQNIASLGEKSLSAMKMLLMFASFVQKIKQNATYVCLFCAVILAKCYLCLPLLCRKSSKMLLMFATFVQKIKQNTTYVCLFCAENQAKCYLCLPLLCRKSSKSWLNIEILA